MPLKVQNNTIRLALSPFVFFDGLNQRVSRSLGNIDPTLCRIPGLVPVSEQLKDKGLVGCESDCEVIELKHLLCVPTSGFSERGRNLREVTRLFKINVLSLFSSENRPKTARALRVAFQEFCSSRERIFNNRNSNRVHNRRLSPAITSNKNVRPRNISKQVYIELYTASFACGGL